MSDLFTLAVLKKAYIDPRGNSYYPKQYYLGEIPAAIRENSEYVSLLENVTTVVQPIIKTTVETDLLNKTEEVIKPTYSKVEYKDETQPQAEVVVEKQPSIEVQAVPVKDITSPSDKEFRQRRKTNPST